jgi:hypothetical protein
MIMKNTYMAPTTKVQKIVLQRMITTSGPHNVYSDEAYGISNADNVLSRRTDNSGLWDDDEE